jgi:hypothetical protein
MVAEVRHGVKVEIEGLTREDRLSNKQSVPAGKQMLDFPRGDPGGIFGQKALFGYGVEAAEEREPWSATNAITWLLRSIDHSLRASEARSACSVGIMREPGSLAFRASASQSNRIRSGTNRNNPPTLVVNSRGESAKPRTSATASVVGPINTGRSSSSPRGNGAKPSAAKISRYRGGAQYDCLLLSARLMS